MAAPSQTRSCNAALAHLGESRRIASISDNSPLAKLFLAVWDETVEEVLAEHPWNVAISRQTLPASATFVPDGGQYTQAFEKPADCVRWLPWREDHQDYFTGEEEGDYILSSAQAPITVRFIRLIADIVKWSPGMRAVLEAKLARKLAKAITGQTGMMRMMQDLYEETLSDAKRQDGAATGDRARGMVSRSDWLGARNAPWTGVRG